MKVTATLAALSLGLAVSGIAQAAQPEASLTRAEVVQELHAAQAQGLITYVEDNQYPRTVTPSTKSRAEVVNELRLAQSQGLVASVNQNDYPRQAEANSQLSRAQVLAQLNQARKNGTLDPYNDNSYPL